MTIVTERDVIIREAVAVSPTMVKSYADNHGWHKVPHLHGKRYWLMEHPDHELRQLVIPQTQNDDDWGDALYSVAYTLADLENTMITEMFNRFK